MPSKPKLSMEDQIIFWFSTAPADQAEALMGRIKGVVSQRRRASKTFVRKAKVNARAKEVKTEGVEQVQ